MNIFIRVLRRVDIWVNYTVGKIKRVWSDYGGKKGQTISSSLGAEEAETLYEYWKQGRDVTKIDDIPISGKHLLGEFSSDLCDLFQRHHALRSIDWDKEGELLVKYPGIKDVVNHYLVSKGIKEGFNA